MTAFFRSIRFWMGFALAIGLFASAYLFYTYVEGGPIVCGLTQGCDIVRASRWAYIGSVPLPFFGVIFYAGMLALLVVRSLLHASSRVMEWLKRFTLFGACVGCLESISLFFVQWREIGVFCTWCLVSGAAATTVCVLAWFDAPTNSEEERLSDLRGYAVIMALLSLVGIPLFLLLVRPTLLGL